MLVRKKYPLIITVFITLLFAAISMLTYLDSTLKGEIKYHFLPAKFFGVPKDLKERNIEVLYKGNESGWDGQFYYYISNDIFAVKDTAEHIDANAYRYQRIGLPLTAKIFSLLSFQDWVSPLTYYLTSLILVLVATIAGAFLFKKLGFSEFLILFWSLGLGTHLTMINGLPDAVADSYLILAIVSFYFERKLLYSIFATMAALSREAYIIFPFIFLLVQFFSYQKDTLQPFYNKVFDYFKSCKYVMHVVPGIIFLLWQIFIINKFQIRPSQQAINILDYPFFSIFEMVFGAITGNHHLYNKPELLHLAKREIYSVALFVILLLSFIYFCFKLLFKNSNREFSIFNFSIASASLAIGILYSCFGSTVMMDYTGYMKAANVMFFLLPLVFILYLKRIPVVYLIFLTFITIYFSFYLFYNKRINVGYAVNYNNPEKIEFSTFEPNCLKKYKAKITPLSFEKVGSKKIIGDPINIINVLVENTGDESFLPYLGKGGTNVSYHIIDASDNSVYIDGIRTILPKELKPNETVESKVQIKLPKEKGNYLIRLSMVQEGCAWFYNANNRSKTDIPYSIK